jgi:hypothetical protein
MPQIRRANCVFFGNMHASLARLIGSELPGWVGTLVPIDAKNERPIDWPNAPHSLNSQTPKSHLVPGCPRAIDAQVQPIHTEPVRARLGTIGGCKNAGFRLFPTAPKFIDDGKWACLEKMDANSDETGQELEMPGGCWFS